MYKFLVKDSFYKEWSIVDNTSLTPIILPQLNPVETKLFNNDIFTYNESLLNENENENENENLDISKNILVDIVNKKTSTNN